MSRNTTGIEPRADDLGLPTHFSPEVFAGATPAPKASELPPITDEDRQFLHYNPNTSDIVEWIEDYARRALAASAVPAGENASGASCSMVASGAEEGMRDAAPELCRDNDGSVSIDYANAAGMLSMSFSKNGSVAWAVLLADGRRANHVAWMHEFCFKVLDQAMKDADSEPSAGAAVQEAAAARGPDQPEPRQQEPNQSTEANKGSNHERSGAPSA